MSAGERGRRGWALSNWPVRWKVLAIVLVPLVLAGAFGGLRIYAERLRRTGFAARRRPRRNGAGHRRLHGRARRRDAGRDRRAATPRPRLTAFDTSKAELQQRLAGTDVDARRPARASTRLLDDGQDLIGQGHGATPSICATGSRPTRRSCSPPKTRSTVSVRVDDEQIRAETLGLSRAVGARGQMMMQQLLVNRGGELPEPELRTSMITLAGTEPSTLFGMSQVLGVGSPRGRRSCRRSSSSGWRIMSDPAAVLVDNPDLTASIQATNEIADKLIAQTASSVTGGGGAAGRRTAQRRDPRRRHRRCGASCWRWPLVTLVARSLVRPLRRLRDSALQGGTRGPGPRDRRRSARRRAGPDPADPRAHLRGDRPGRARRRRAARAGRPAGRRAGAAAAAGQRHVRDAVAAQPVAGRPAAVAHRPPRTQRGGSRIGWRACSGWTTSPPGCAATAPTCWCWPAPRCRASRPSRCRCPAIINAAASEVEDYTRVVTATVPDSEIARCRRRRPGAPAGRAARQRAALLAADLPGPGVGGAHRQRRPGHRGQRHRPRHDRVRSAGGQHPAAVRRRGQPVHRAAHGSVRGRAGSPRSTAWWSGCAARLPGEPVRAPPPVCSCRPSCSSSRRTSPPTRYADVSAARPTRTPSATTGRRPGHTTRAVRRKPEPATGRHATEFGCCRNAIPEPAASPVTPEPHRRRPSRRAPPTLGVLRVARAGRQHRPAPPGRAAAAQARAARRPTGRRHRGRHRRRRRRRDLPEDAVRMAGRSARSGEQHRPGLGSRCGTTAGRRRRRPRTRRWSSTPRKVCRCASPAPGWCPGAADAADSAGCTDVNGGAHERRATTR